MTETTAAPCYRAPNDVRFTRNAHRHDCDDPTCRGCRPCTHRHHCTAKRNCTWHVAEGELTCGRCLATTRRDLAWIAALAPLMSVEALAAGVDSEAAFLAGPAADPEAWAWRKASAHRAWHVSLIEPSDEHHPYTVLGTWDMLIREDYDHPSDEPVTVANAAAYLDRQLYRIANDEHQDFPLLARELRKCRQHLEAVLHNDTRPERGVPCPACVEKQEEVVDDLIARGVPREEWPKLTAPRLQRHYPHWCEDDECARIHHADDREDVWRCPRDGDHEWNQRDYENRLTEREKVS